MEKIKTCLLFLMTGLQFASCNNRGKADGMIISQLGSDLNAAIDMTQAGTKALCMDLTEKMYRPSTTERATLWNDKAVRADSILTQWERYVAIEPVASPADLRSFLQASDSVLQMLSAIDSNMTMSLSASFKLRPSATDSLQKFNPVSADYPPDAISIFKENLLFYSAVLKNKIVTYCDNQIGATDADGFMTKTSFLLGQNTTHLRRGETLEITAGEGRYTFAGSPKVLINGKAVAMPDGRADYKFKVNEPPGKHVKPVLFRCTDENGTLVTSQVEITYTVDE